MKIIARNLSRETTQAELTALFAEFGLVESCTLVLDKDTGKSKGFGFVEMGSDQEAQTAINALHGKEISGRTLTVNEARPKEDRPRRDFNGGGSSNGGGSRGGNAGGSSFRQRSW